MNRDRLSGISNQVGDLVYKEPQRYILPDGVKLMGREIKIEYIDKEHMSSMGMYIEKKNLIQIDNSMHQAIQERTLIHEVVHAILIDLGEQELNNNEGFVERLANMVHLFIKDNKKIIV